MKKALKKQAAFVVLSAAVAVQTGFPGYAATTVTGNWANEDGGWKFYNSDHQAYTGWVKTESGWYYILQTLRVYFARADGRRLMDSGTILRPHRKALRDGCIPDGIKPQKTPGISLKMVLEVLPRVIW